MPDLAKNFIGSKFSHMTSLRVPRPKTIVPVRSATDEEGNYIPLQPPSVHHDHKPVLFSPDGKALVRKAGF